MEYRIEQLNEFKIVGYVKHTTNTLMKGMRDCPSFWKQIIKRGMEEPLMPLIDRPPFGLIGASFYNVNSTDPKKFDYYIGVATNQATPEGLVEIIVPARTWAVFPCTRKTSRKTQMNIVNKWAPISDYNLLNSGYASGKMISDAPDMEVYSQGESVEIWVAVKEKYDGYKTK